jgi:hypothetical protein
MLLMMHLGLKDTNVEGDLVVEHYNGAFKVSNILVYDAMLCFVQAKEEKPCMLYMQEILENLKGSYEEERIATMAVSLDIKKELEAKLYPTYADRLVI